MARAKYKKGDGVLTTVRGWTVGKTPNTNTKYVRVKFNNYIDWTGWLTPKTIAKTMEALETMGFKYPSLNMLAQDDALDTETEIIAVIDEIREHDGKHYYSAAWINKNAAFGFDDKAKDMLDEFDFDTRAYISDTKELEEPIPAQQEYTQNNNTDFTADDIPF